MDWNKNNIEAWPRDWDLHLVKAFHAYFEKKDHDDLGIAFNSATNLNSCYCDAYSKIEDINLIVTFCLKGKYYTIKFQRKDEFVCGKLSFILEFVMGADVEGDCFPRSSILRHAYLDDVGIVKEQKHFDIIKSLETLIWEDYWRRNRNDDDETETPVEPIVPSDIILVK